MIQDSRLQHTIDTIKKDVHVPAYVQMLGFSINRGGFIHCPFHPDQTASLKLYGCQRWHCYSCGAHGDVIEFARLYYRLTFKQAVLRVATDAGVPLPDATEITYSQAVELQRTRDRRKEQEHVEREKQATEKAYWSVLDDYLEIDRRYKDLDEIISRMTKSGYYPHNTLMTAFFKTVAARNNIYDKLQDLESRRLKQTNGCD